MTTYTNGLPFDSSSRLMVTDLGAAAVPNTAKFNMGMAFNQLDGSLYVTSDSVSSAFYNMGLAFRNDGALFVTSTAPGTAYSNGSFITNSDGAAFLAEFGTISVYRDGIGFTSTGAAVSNGLSRMWLMDATIADDITSCCTVAPTITRAGTSLTRFNSSGVMEDVAANTWLRDYDPSTLALIGFVPWGARTNLLLQSEVFDNASWTKTDSTITANQRTAPDGTSNADLVTEGSAGTAVVSQSVTATANATYAVTMFFAMGNHNWIRFQVDDAGANAIRGWFNLNTMVAGTTSVLGAGSVSSTSIQTLPNGLCRITIIGAVNGGSTAIRTFACSAASDGSATRVSGGTRYQWGAMFEDGASDASAYIRTTTATVTRPANVATLATAGISGFSATTLTMTGRGYRRSATSSTSTMLCLSDGTTSNLHRIGVAASNASTGATTTGGVAQSAITSSTWAAATASGIAYRAAANNFALSFAGGAEVTDTSGTMPSLTTLHIGHLVGSTGFWGGGILNLGLYNVAQTNLQNYST